MNVDILKAIDVCGELNEVLFDHDNDNNRYFSVTTTGGITFIKFDDEVLWRDDEDERDFNEEKNEYSDLYQHICRKFNEYVDELITYKFQEP